ncbi:MAG: hemerythrin family protein [Rhodospirillaceae bacterium]
MAPTWNEAMATGVVEIDGDHRKIAAVFDDVLQSLAENQPREMVIMVLTRLVDALCEHIDHEEALMRSIGYPDTAPHHRDHDQYFSMLSQLVFDCQTGNGGLSQNSLGAVKAWKTKHLETFDRPLAEAIRRRPVG